MKVAEWLPRDAGTLVWSSVTLNSALSSCIFLGKLLFPFFFFFLKADLCTQLVLIFQMAEIGLVHGNSGDISLICCFNLSLNFWTDFIDFSAVPFAGKAQAGFLLLANCFPSVLRGAVQVSQGCSWPRSQLVRAGTSASAQQTTWNQKIMSQGTLCTGDREL